MKSGGHETVKGHDYRHAYRVGQVVRRDDCRTRIRGKVEELHC